MIYNCTSCGVLWTAKQTKTKVEVRRVPRRICVDCSTYDYPLYTKRKVDAEKSLAKPSKDK